MIKSVRILFTAILIALPLLVLSYAISYVIKDPTKSLELVLLIVGAIPVFSFGPGIFARSPGGTLQTPKVMWRLVDSSNQNDDGSHSGVLFTPYVIYHLVRPSKQNKNESRSGVDKKNNVAASLSLVLSGGILWAVSFFV